MLLKFNGNGDVSTEQNYQRDFCGDKFETHGTVRDVHRGGSGRSRTSVSPASSAMVLERFEHSPQKSRW